MAFFALDAATTSAKVLYSEPAWVASTMGDVPISAIGTRSFLVSNGSLGISAGFTPCVSNTTAKV